MTAGVQSTSAKSSHRQISKDAAMRIQMNCHCDTSRRDRITQSDSSFGVSLTSREMIKSARGQLQQLIVVFTGD